MNEKKDIEIEMKNIIEDLEGAFEGDIEIEELLKILNFLLTYLVFDNECLERENDYLRKLLKKEKDE